MLLKVTSVLADGCGTAALRKAEQEKRRAYGCAPPFMICNAEWLRQGQTLSAGVTWPRWGGNPQPASVLHHEQSHAELRLVRGVSPSRRHSGKP